MDVHPLPPLLHNRPERIAAAVEQRVRDLRQRYDRVAVAYADCGTYGALDDAVAWAGARNGREQAGADHTGVHS